MKRLRSLMVVTFSISFGACVSDIVHNKSDDKLEYSNLESDYRLTDLNNYGCEKVDRSSLLHILETGQVVSDREIHDHYSITGCTISGRLSVNGVPAQFTFDYGGIFTFSDGTKLGCGKDCCKDGFTFCSYDEEDLKGS
jgi:hypothetical protein